jgi:hypothetical protein
LNAQASLSLDPFADEIVESGASRVFARSAFEYGHDPEPPADEAATFVAAVLHPELAATRSVPPQPAISKQQTPSRATLSAARPFELAFTSFNSS